MMRYMVSNKDKQHIFTLINRCKLNYIMNTVLNSLYTMTELVYLYSIKEYAIFM